MRIYHKENMDYDNNIPDHLKDDPSAPYNIKDDDGNILDLDETVDLYLCDTDDEDDLSSPDSVYDF